MQMRLRAWGFPVLPARSMRTERASVLPFRSREHMVLNALAATAVGRALGLTMQEIKAGIEALEPVGGRFHIINHGDIQIIDDCYNANPVSMKASLDVLRDAKGRKVAILGDMGELGENEEQMHAEVGYHAAKNKIDLLICTGKISSHMAEAAMQTAAVAKCCRFRRWRHC